MPEGPEIRRAADQVEAALVSRPAEQVFFAFDRLKPYEDQLTGRMIQKVTTRGKAMLTRFEGGLSVYSHNQLYGVWRIVPTGQTPKTKRQLRFAVRTGIRDALLYSASDIDVLDADAEREHPFLARLGPDILSQAPTPDALAERLDAPRFRGRQLGALLLDQGFVAGLGNYLRAEILFESGIHPRRRARDCSTDERERLAERTIAITRTAYDTRGITLPPEIVAPLKAAGGRRNSYRFWVYGRGSQACRRCETPIVGEAVGGRTCYWCPACQAGR